MIAGAVEYRCMSLVEVSEAAVELRALYAEVFSLPPYNEGPELADEFLERSGEARASADGCSTSCSPVAGSVGQP